MSAFNFENVEQMSFSLLLYTIESMQFMLKQISEFMCAASHPVRLYSVKQMSFSLLLHIVALIFNQQKSKFWYATDQ
jgi:hypothetical protein